MFNQTSINDFFPKGNGGDKSGIGRKCNKNGNIKTYFNNHRIEDNHVSKPLNIQNIDKNKGCDNNKFKNIFNGEDIIERVEVFTDGSTINNGKKNASGGIGIFFYEEDLKNLSERSYSKGIKG